MITVRRVHRGIADHFPIRLSEWLMAYAATGMGIALMVQPEMFSTSPSFSTLQQWGDEGFWSVICLLCATVRLLALTVNGTFDNFRYSPHIRLGASVVAITFWSQFTLGFTVAYLFNGGSASAVFAYSTFVLAELANIYRAWADIGKGHQKH